MTLSIIVSDAPRWFCATKIDFISLSDNDDEIILEQGWEGYEELLEQGYKPYSHWFENMAKNVQKFYEHISRSCENVQTFTKKPYLPCAILFASLLARVAPGLTTL